MPPAAPSQALRHAPTSNTLRKAFAVGGWWWLGFGWGWVGFGACGLEVCKLGVIEHVEDRN